MNEEYCDLDKGKCFCKELCPKCKFNVFKCRYCVENEKISIQVKLK